MILNICESFVSFLLNHQDSRLSVQTQVQFLQNHTFVYDDSGNIIAWSFDFIRDQERNFAIIVSSKHQKKGLGIELINQAKKNNSVLNGWVIISQSHKKQDSKPYKSPLEFYQKLGFQTLEEEKEIQGLRLVKIRFEE